MKTQAYVEIGDSGKQEQWRYHQPIRADRFGTVIVVPVRHSDQNKGEPIEWSDEFRARPHDDTFR